MIIADIPADEDQRLGSLQSFRILDTMPEQEYDDITRIAAEICETPISLVSLVDGTRQWFKSRHGLDAEETPRDLAFCAHAILQPKSMFLIEDARQDPRFADNPLVTGAPHVRFYAGIPLVSSEGQPLGTLCVIDRKPNRLTPGQEQAMAALARQVMAQMELRRKIAQLESHAEQLEQSRCELLELCTQLEDQAETIERDLERAELIQRSLLPHDAPLIPDFHLHSLYRPGRQIGGDFFEIKVIANRYLAVIIADASGHGISAAMLCVLFQHKLEVADPVSGMPFAPAAAITRMNDAIVAEVTAPGVFVTAAYCLFDTLTRDLVITSAGHPPLLCLRGNGEVEAFDHTGPAIGLYEDATFGEVRTRLAPGERLFMFTDGLLEVPGASTTEVDELIGSLRQFADSPAPLDAILAHFSRGAGERDDVTLLMMNAFAGENRFLEMSSLIDEGVAPATEDASLRYAETDTTTFICMSGRMTWVFADALLRAVVDLLAQERRIVLDLSDCDYLDSTMLGTLHELVEKAGNTGNIKVQGVASKLSAAFEELCLDDVMEHVTTEAEPVPPTTREIRPPVSDLRRQRQRLIKAHEALSAVNDANRKEFEQVLHSLRT